MISLIIGFITGVLFSVFKLPIPAPPALEGVLGIVGIWLGYEAVIHGLPYLITVIHSIR